MKNRIKLDENFSHFLVDIFDDAGFDAHSVFSENLIGASDEVIFHTVNAENRILITFDTDFCNIINYPPDDTEGIIVIRPNRPISIGIIRRFAEQIVQLLKTNNPKGCLWVLEPGKLRIRSSDNN
jgi:predicted nuclease of predicted toxin-antitoxin system